MKNLPITLPEGWTSEPYGEEDVVILVAPKRAGYVSVSEKRRNYTLGMGMPRKSAIGPVAYSGRGWKAKLFTAALESLQRALNGAGQHSSDLRAALYGR
ncbi:hypothetical protein [Burkholderia vietnamiensis]|uniref:hypothetical protein n=1 Tax=Burkholderia vietnamiensis TaxID=60552 RepID=UPI001CB434B6|nr:hypothetical protein [Burkholderia vietnamiensis]CAG9229134.1 conserved hypothetical protein [Burkholderia vietnamiensis]